MPATPSPAFDFGENWRAFSDHALDAVKVAEARRHFGELLAGLPLAGRSFLDIGFGQGLSLLAAAAAGARAVGCDLNPKCAEVVRRNRGFFSELTENPPLIVGSILDDDVVERLRAAAPGGAGYDIVHSWGVLHHTGDMARALRNAAGLVGTGGHWVIAIYNRHWSSPAWKAIKWTYVHSPRWLQRGLVGACYPLIYAAKRLVTGRNPKSQGRGMDFYYDVIDWVGGYPYEYASRAEITKIAGALGFELAAFRPATVPTGCHEYVFRRKDAVR